MGQLRIESRADGSLLLTDTGGARWGIAAAGAATGTVLLGSVLTGGAGVLGAVVMLPLAVIAGLAGVAAARHRDWIVFDRGARQILFRRGPVAMFRAVSAVPFDEVEAIVVEEPGGPPGPMVVALRRDGDVTWPIDVTGDREAARHLVAALRDVGGWPVLHERERAPS
jgi:hypothetical protein